MTRPSAMTIEIRPKTEGLGVIVMGDDEVPWYGYPAEFDAVVEWPSGPEVILTITVVSAGDDIATTLTGFKVRRRTPEDIMTFDVTPLYAWAIDAARAPVRLDVEGMEEKGWRFAWEKGNPRPTSLALDTVKPDGTQVSIRVPGTNEGGQG